MTDQWMTPHNGHDQSWLRRREDQGGFPPETRSLSHTVRISDMVTPPRIPPGEGWRKLLYNLSFGTINLGESKSERRYRELRTRIRCYIRKQYVIGVLSGKGGVGKTTMAACIGSVFKECRPDNAVAIDAAPGFGTLAARIDENPPGDYGTLLNDNDIQGYADIKQYLGQNSAGLDVLAGSRLTDRPRPILPIMFTGAMSRLRRSHNVIVVDTSNDFEHPSMPSVLDSCDTLVFVSGLTADTSFPVTRAIDQLWAMGYQDLVARSMIILNDSRNKYDARVRRYLTESFARFGATVEFMPFDRHLAMGGVVDIDNGLSKRTRLRLYEITAALADKYIADKGHPPMPAAESSQPALGALGPHPN